MLPKRREMLILEALLKDVSTVGITIGAFQKQDIVFFVTTLQGWVYKTQQTREMHR